MQTVIRVVLAYFLLLVAFRMLGKRELGKMSPFELVTLLFIPQLFSRALTRQDYSFTNAVIGASTLLSLVWLTSAVTYRFRGAAHVVEGEPTVLIANGVLIAEAMDRERVSGRALMSELRRAGLSAVEQVKWAILETSGTITIVPQPDVPGHAADSDGDEGAQGF